MASRNVSLGSGPILLALSEPQYAHAVIRVARVLCGREARAVELLHASEPASSSEEVLERLELTIQDVEGFVVEPLEGPAESVLPQAAETRQASLLVIGLGPDRAEPGLVLQSLLTQAPCPVLLVPPALREGWGEGGVILLPLDGTPSTASVAPLAIELAARSAASLEILYAGVPLAPSEPGSMGLPPFLDQPQHEWAMWKREFLYRFSECFWGGKLPVDVRLHLATGEPSDAILERAEGLEPDVIVIGWHGELQQARARTLRKVLALARWPVLTARVSRL